MRVLNAAQMREADRITIDEIGIRSLVLMECAGRQVVSTAELPGGHWTVQLRWTADTREYYYEQPVVLR